MAYPGRLATIRHTIGPDRGIAVRAMDSQHDRFRAGSAFFHSLPSVKFHQLKLPQATNTRHNSCGRSAERNEAPVPNPIQTRRSLYLMPFPLLRLYANSLKLRKRLLYLFLRSITMGLRVKRNTLYRSILPDIRKDNQKIYWRHHLPFLLACLIRCSVAITLAKCLAEVAASRIL